MKLANVLPEEAAANIAETINSALQNGSVLWLVSGGSNIQIAVNVRNELELAHNLTVGLVDERYGRLGHHDSNWTQLIKAGFDISDIRQLPILAKETLPEEGQTKEPQSEERQLKATAENYSQRLQEAVDSCGIVIAVFGMGADGHTAGILPGSPAVNTTETVTGYIGQDFRRITITPAFFSKINVAFLVSYGEAKHSQIARLLNEDLPTSEQPVQALKQINRLMVYSDYRTEYI